MISRKHLTRAGLVLSSAALGLGTILAPDAGAASPGVGPQAWSCREATASITGARVSASICWQSGTAKVAGQIYDTKADKRSACVQISHNGESPYNYCNHGGSGSSKHFVTGEFGYIVPVNIRACTENSLTPARCGAYH